MSFKLSSKQNNCENSSADAWKKVANDSVCVTDDEIVFLMLLEMLNHRLFCELCVEQTTLSLTIQWRSAAKNGSLFLVDKHIQPECITLQYS